MQIYIAYFLGKNKKIITILSSAVFAQRVLTQLAFFYKSTAGRYWPVSDLDGPITARCRFIKNAYWVNLMLAVIFCQLLCSCMPHFILFHIVLQ